MAEQPLDADEAGADLPEGLIPPDAMEEAGDLDTPDAPPVGLPIRCIVSACNGTGPRFAS